MPRSLPNTSARRKLLYALLGDLPQRQRPIQAKKLGEEDRESYVLERWVLDLNGAAAVPTVFCRPLRAAKPYPAVLFNHAHGGDYKGGKQELTEPKAILLNKPHAHALAQRGIASCCIDQWNFGERHQRPESELFKEHLWFGRVLWGLMVYDNLRALDWLCARRDVDAARIGTLGLSMGATMSWWTAALDERVKVTADLCCLTDFHELIRTRGLDGHGLYYFVPSLLKHFDTAGINALIAPRPHLTLNGDYDRLTPPAGLDTVERAMKKVYRQCGAPDAWKSFRDMTGHFETHAMRAEILTWFERWL